MLLLPTLFTIEGITDDDLEEILETSKEINKQLYEIDELMKLEKKFQQFFSIIEKNPLTFCYIFFTEEKGRPNKIQMKITDVPPSRLVRINNVQLELYSQKCIKTKYPISLKTIYHDLPVRIDKKTYLARDIDDVLTLFDAILKEKPMKKKPLMSKFVKMMKVILMEKNGYNYFGLSNFKKPNLNEKILEMNSIIELLEKLNVFVKETSKEMTEMDKEALNGIPESTRKEIVDYWIEKSVYNQFEARSLFLLGMLIAEVGNAQYSERKSEPILKKVNFNGINTERIKFLISDVEGKMVNFKLLGDKKQFNKGIIYAMHHYYERCNDWKLTPDENVFFIMSGYSFKNTLISKFSKEKKQKQNESKSD